MNVRKFAPSSSSVIQLSLAGTFIAISLLMASSGFGADLDKVQTALVTIPVTVAIFAVNFSFLEYQFSSYRGISRGISISHVVAAAGVLLLALAPLVALYLDWRLRVIAGIVIPLVTYASVGPALFARRNADRIHQLDSATHHEPVWTFLGKYSELRELISRRSKNLSFPSLSWVIKIEGADRDNWIRLFSEAFSRLRGVSCEIEVKGANVLIKESGKPHQQDVLDNQTARTIDYSDFSFVKELAIY